MGTQIDPERKARRFRLFQETTEAWPNLGIYQRFEQAVALVLTLLISGVIVAATAHLVLVEVRDYLLNPLAPMDAASFQSIFGMIMTVLIALEFNHATPQGKHCTTEDRDSHSFACHGEEIHHHRLHRPRAARGPRARLCCFGARAGLLAGAGTGPPRGRT